MAVSIQPVQEFLGFSEAELDAPIYRVFPLWFFQEAIRLKQLVLYRPHRWEDPFEDMCSRVMMTDQSLAQHTQTSLETFLKPTFAQCWSLEGRSDVLLRAYSKVSKDPHFRRNTEPRFEGVQVESTPRLILQAISEWVAARDGVYACVGRVHYKSEKEILQQIVNYIARHGAERVGRGALRAKLLLLKREVFRHENEVRVVLTFEDDPAPRDLLKITVDPNLIFKSVRFDPRLEEFERIEHENAARAGGYTGGVGRDGWYQGILLNAVFPNGWSGEQ